jgi:hypothetical protein
MEFLRRSYELGSTKLEQELRKLISIQTNVNFRPYDGMQETVRVEYRYHKENRLFMSPLQEKEIFWHIAQNVCEEIRRAIQAREMSSSMKVQP